MWHRFGSPGALAWKKNHGPLHVLIDDLQKPPIFFDRGEQNFKRMIGAWHRVLPLPSTAALPASKSSFAITLHLLET